MAEKRTAGIGPDPAAGPVIMGIINATPDSFFAGSRRAGRDEAVAAACRMVEAGAGIIDVGGESTRPGSAPVGIDEETERVLPVIEGIVARVGVAVSVDTRHAPVAAAAVAAGAAIVNDIGGLGDPVMRTLVAETGAYAIIMHMQGEPATMQAAPEYTDVLAEVGAFLDERVRLALAAGIARDRLWLDPGIGFGKRLEDNLALIAGLGTLARAGLPLVVGLSRKSFIGAVTGQPVEERLLGTCLYNLAALERGATVLRVHDVAEAVLVRSVWKSLGG